MKIAKLTILSILIMVAPGCGTALPAAQVVNVPVFTPCVKSVPARPAFAALALPAGASDGEKVLALARDTIEHFKYEGLLEAAIAGCMLY